MDQQILQTVEKHKQKEKLRGRGLLRFPLLCIEKFLLQTKEAEFQAFKSAWQLGWGEGALLSLPVALIAFLGQVSGVSEFPLEAIPSCWLLGSHCSSNDMLVPEESIMPTTNWQRISTHLQANTQHM